MTPRRLLIASFALLVVAALLLITVLNREKPQDDELVVLAQGAPLTLDPVATMELDSAFLGNMVHAPLMRLGADGVLIPVLAKSIMVEADAMSAVIELRSEAKFWDGSEVRSADVAASLLRLRDSRNPLGFAVNRIGTVEEIDPLRLRVSFTKPEPDFPRQVAFLQAAIVKKDSLGLPKQPYDSQVIGAGGWIPEPDSFKAGSEFRFRRNPGFPEASKTGHLKVVVLSDPQARLTALQRGEAQIARLRGPEVREAMQGSGSGQLRSDLSAFQLHSQSASDACALLINWKHPVFASLNEASRRALFNRINQKMPRNLMAATVTGSEPLTSVVPPVALREQRVFQSARDDERSSATPQLEVELMAANDAASRELANLVVGPLRDMGLMARVTLVDIGSMVASVAGGKHQLCVTYFEMPLPGAEGWLMLFDESTPFSAFGQPLPGIRGAIEVARGELDPAKRVQAWNEVAGKVMAEQTGWVPLLTRKTLVITADRVSGNFVDQCGTPVGASWNSH